MIGSMRRGALALMLGGAALSACGDGSTEPLASCNGTPSGTMSGKINGKSWAAGVQTTVTPSYIDGRLVSITVVGIPCDGIADRATRLQLRVVRLTGVETGTISLGPVSLISRNSAWGSVTIGDVEYRSDWSDETGAGTGTLQLTGLSNVQVEGRFEFTAVPSPKATSRTRVTVSSGVFTIPMSAAALASRSP